jgi:sulfatase maturation enzyme AslB (radical SAM superfamily)
MNLAPAPQPNHTDYWLAQVENYIGQQPDNSVNLKLLGGEPLMQQRNLEKLLELNGSKIHKLIVQTNFNPPTNKFLLWILENISNEKLVIDISLDATASYNHVVRAGFDRERFESNLVLIRQHNINYRITSVVSVLSLFDSPNFIRWNQEHGHKITYTKINNPACLSADLLPVHIKQELAKTIDQPPPPIVAELLAASTESNQIQLLEQYNYLTQYFNRAKIDTDTIDNVLFQNWWSWLKGTVKQ